MKVATNCCNTLWAQHQVATSIFQTATAQDYEVHQGQGIVETIAETGVAGYADGCVSGAQISEPGGLAVLTSGNILLADT
jgi:hypothetical protein